MWIERYDDRFNAWFSYLVYSYPCINISVRCTFVIRLFRFSYQYCGAPHLKDQPQRGAILIEIKYS